MHWTKFSKNVFQRLCFLTLKTCWCYPIIDDTLPLVALPIPILPLASSNLLSVTSFKIFEHDLFQLFILRRRGEETQRKIAIRATWKGKCNFKSSKKSMGLVRTSRNFNRSPSYRMVQLYDCTAVHHTVLHWDTAGVWHEGWIGRD